MTENGVHHEVFVPDVENSDNTLPEKQVDQDPPNVRTFIDNMEHHHQQQQQNFNHFPGATRGNVGRVQNAAHKQIYDLLNERNKLENTCPLAVKLIDEALERVHLNGRLPAREHYVDIFHQRTIKLCQKVQIPMRDKFNYVGKLLGPKGSSLRRLQEETQCRILILGRCSMRDRSREEELRSSGDIKYAHLNLPLHVEVSTVALPAEAYARVAYALAELRRAMIPDKFNGNHQDLNRGMIGEASGGKRTFPYALQHNVSMNGNNNMDYNSGNRGISAQNSPGQYRPKYPPVPHHINQQYHYATSSQSYDENAYYRSPHNASTSGNFFQQMAKPFMAAAVMGGQPVPNGPMAVLNTPNYSGHGAGSVLVGNPALTGPPTALSNSSVEGANAASNRYRRRTYVPDQHLPK